MKLSFFVTKCHRRDKHGLRWKTERVMRFCRVLSRCYVSLPYILGRPSLGLYFEPERYHRVGQLVYTLKQVNSIWWLKNDQEYLEDTLMYVTPKQMKSS